MESNCHKLNQHVMEFLLPSQTQSLWPRASPWARVQDSYTLQKKKIETGRSKTAMKIISVVDQLHWWGSHPSTVGRVIEL